ncbi:Zn-dependent hydrolase [Halocalculus aciditolerans]|uniref:Zn-dependent hydrolase n=1 Tax=Halocalculus aciditolerans TaxID=1383812 RepID=A0A830FCC6_9EURY|nr:Zn-dependent hydrolase [Halocalculus aciditolerans]GGL60717.1 Zn-dependent hydrolase [Halocalculus aciditolerans]
MQADAERLRGDIEANGEFGAVDALTGRGRTCLTGSEANQRARERFVRELENAGLDVRVDAVGNIVGTWRPPSADPDAKAVASGSHLDSVPEGGLFDGPLGAYGALEAVRAMQDAGFEPSRPVEVVSFTEEEGQTFADGLLGSSVAAGDRTVDDALALTDGEGHTLEAALADIGFDGTGRVSADEWDAFLELHVEQGERLERAGAGVGVVSTITGITHCDVTVRGEADHAGATPMAERTDALAAASEFVLDVEEAANAQAADAGTTVGTVGSLDVSPNATNVVPGRVEMGVDVRDVEYDRMERVVAAAKESLERVEAERGVDTEFRRPFDLPPTPMTERVRDASHAAAADAGVDALGLHSAAAHDAMNVAKRTDAGMLFAPSEGGYSHSPKEWTDWSDCADAVTVLANALAELAG